MAVFSAKKLTKNTFFAITALSLSMSANASVELSDEAAMETARIFFPYMPIGAKLIIDGEPRGTLGEEVETCTRTDLRSERDLSQIRFIVIYSVRIVAQSIA